MFFIPFIRDYIEFLNNVYDSILTDINLQILFKETLFYFFESGKFFVFYIFTFQWFRDILYLPVILPKISAHILKETFFLEAPLENFFTLLSFPMYQNNKFIIGIYNSFFLSLPISCSHFIYLRRLLIQGNAAGIAAGLGNIFGQIFFIASIIFGFRFLIVSWFSFEMLSYILGFLLLIIIVYEMVHERIIKILDWKDHFLLIKIFFLNFFLIWTEQSCIFQFLGNLTISPNSTILETFSSSTKFDFLASHCFYLLGLFLGCLFFNILFAISLQKLSEFIQIQFNLLKSTWIIWVNFSLLTIIVAFSFSSIPYYGLDYLTTSSFGFISNDKAFKNTIFSENELHDPFGILGGLSDNLSLNTDVTSFDRGFYLKSPILQTFEDLNYSGEYATTIRQGNIPLFDQYKEKARKIRAMVLQNEENVKDNDLQQTSSYQNDKKNSINNEFVSAKQEYPTSYPLDNKVFLSSNLQKRFDTNYVQSPNITFENAMLGTLNSAFSDEKFTVLFPAIETKIKERFYSNPIYKFLLTIDIDTFLKRQPKDYLLSPTQENELYKKRLVLSKYHDTLRIYNTLPYVQEFLHFFNGSKSFSERVYNQQFKGTLHIVRRLFSISTESNLVNENPNFQRPEMSDNLVLKYDQPLYKSSYGSFNSKTLHDELEHSNIKNMPFLELVNQNPFYFGWDESLRKVVISNRFLPASLSKFVNINNKDFKEVEFSIWPISRKKFLNQNMQSLKILEPKFLFTTKNNLEQFNYTTLFPLFEYEDSDSGISYYQSLPNNITKLASGKMDVIPPTRGGFIWPGSSSLKFSWKNLFTSN